ncbi:MAG TPA: hypothetical protein VHQ64_09385 [Pyrinomonadaceae bacterium]|nr:hypothetical protein [Pyrinomonadaceae bacterium]
MKQCPKCSVTYANDKQKFCTKDGTPLVDAVDASAGQGETVRIDSAQLDDEITKVISQQLPQMSSGPFDPYKTQVSTPEDKAPPPPAPSQPITPPAAAATPAAGTPPVAAATPPVAAVTPPVAAATPPVGAVTPPVAAVTPPVAPPAARAAQPAASATPSAPPTAKKRSKLPLILGILLVLFVLGAGAAVAGYFFLLKPMLDKKRVAVLEPRRPEPTPIVESTPQVNNPKPEAPKIEVPPYSPPADAVQFVNSNAKLTGKLAEHYVDFSFYYPERWRKDPGAGVAGATNFVQVERSLPPNYTQENFAVGWYESAGSADLDRSAFPRLVESLSAKFAKSIGNYQKVSEGETKIGPYDAYEFRFEGQSQQTDRGQFKIWGVSVFVPPTDGSKNGVTLLMLATSLAPELKSVSDVGVKGDLPMMLESFRFGK